MTNEQLTIELSHLDVGYNQTARKLKEDYQRDRQQALDRWAAAHSRFKIGDIIESQGSIIRIDGMRGCKADYGRRYQYYVTYTGQRLTRRLTPYVDGSRTALYDDGTREVKLVRVGKEG